MINFAKFINEAKEVSTSDNPIVLAKDFMNMFNRVNHTTYIYIDNVKYTNKFGNLEGSLFISGTKGLRINFKNNKLFSFSKWNEFAFGKTPTSELLVTNRTKTNRTGLTEICPMVTVWTEHENLPDNRRVLIVMPNAKFEWDLQSAIINLYYDFDMIDLNDIMSWINKNGHSEGYYDDFDTDFIKDVYDLIIEEEQKNKDITSSEMGTIVKDALEDSYPEEYIESDTELTDTVEIEGSDEVIEPDESITLNEEELAAQLVADPLPVFEKLNSYVLQIARGIDTALLITGQGGVGKSYNVNRILSAFGTKNKDYVIMKGNSTTAAMYKFLYDNYNKICVFDDCDAILEDTVGLNILKGALDSGDIREISWNTKGSDMVDTFGCTTHEEIEERMEEWSAKHKGKVGTPNYFQFQGACIFISNKSVEEIAKLDAAILTRCSQVDINLLAHEVILRMKSVLPTIKVFNARGQDITKPDIKQEVFDYISSETFLKDPRMKGKKISFRLFNNTYKLRYGGSPKWKELAFGCC